MNKKAFIPISALIGALLLALVAAMTPFVAERNLAYAQTADSITVKYAENGTDPVVTLSATDPEMDTVTWDLGSGNDESDFMIDADDGVLKFNIDAAQDGSSPGSPDFENPQNADTDNTYVVEVEASDGTTSDTFTVTIEVTNEDEDGKVTWTVDPDGTGALIPASVNGGSPIMQFQVGATLTASLTDGDMSGADKAVTVADGRWRWYRSSSKTSLGTAIEDETSASYTATNSDVGMYIHAEVFYNVGTGREESASLASDHPVLAQQASNEVPEFDPVTVTREVNEGDEKMAVGAPVMATDDIRNALNYTLAGTDETKFEIDQKTGQITTSVKLNYEETAAVVDQCNTANACSVTVTATDSAGAFSTATVAIAIEDVDEKPVFSTADPAVGMTSVTVAEGDTALDSATPANVTYAATDPESGQVSLMLMGADSGLFRLSASGVLSFRTAPDYESPTDANGDNMYEVTVRASDSTLHEDRMVRVSVSNTNEAPMIAELTESVKYAENGTDPVVTLSATDPEMDTVTWDLGSGNDESAFMIDADDGVLKFNIDAAQDGSSPGSPDFENPQNADTDNTYVVEVEASDGTTSDTFTVTIEVTNEDEDGKVTWTVDPDGTGALIPASVNGGSPIMQFQVGATLTASVTDGDTSRANTLQTPTWQWYRSSSRSSLGTAIENETSDSYTVTINDVGRYIHARAFYRVGTAGREESASLASDHPVLAQQASNEVPEFDPVTVTREVNEGDEEMAVGAPVMATDDIRNALNYTLAGTDETKFEIDQKTGQITTSVELNYDSAAGGGDNCAVLNSCVVTVTATDSAAGASATPATVTITLKNVDEKPTFDTGPTSITRNENLAALADSGSESDVTYTATDPEGDRVNLSLMGTDSGLFRLGTGGVLSFRTAPDYENPTDANGDNIYEVTVRASDGTLHEDRMVAVNVSNVNEAPMITAGPSIRGQSSISYAENGTDDVASYEVVGLETGATVGWSLSGDDAGEFDISSSGVLTFASPPDFEGPNDANTDNVYEVTVMAGDGTDSAMLDVRVTVTDVENDMPTDLDLLTRYDADRSGHIDLSEVNAAIDDYFNGDLTLEEVNDVIDLYFM